MSDRNKAAIACIIAAAIIGVLYQSAGLVYRKGVADGRAEMHDDIIAEMQAKGGAPVLLYPSDDFGLEKINRELIKKRARHAEH